MSPAIELTGVTKEYVKLEERGMLLRSLLPFARPTRTPLRALRDFDLVVEPGETIGVVGRNGAGKSTLLRLLAGVSRPSAGTVRIVGRIAPLLSVGVGFHPEMSGRENVYINGLLLGLTADEVAERFDDIVAFAELASFIDTPVKFYSSGMFMRLGFSVAVHVDPDVLLVDEVLAVGDLAFQLKCFDRMRDLKDRGTTILIVSHSMHAIRLLCPRAILLHHGELRLDGPVEDVIAGHHDLLTQADTSQNVHEEGYVGGVEVVTRELVGADGELGNVLGRGAPVVVRTTLRFDVAIDSPQVHFTVLADDRTVVYEMRSVLNRQHRRYEAGTEAEAEIAFTSHLAGGTYRFQLTVTSVDGRRTHYRDGTGMLVYVPPALGSSGVADLGATIALDGDVLNDHPDVAI
jgi:ABC-type polysaccharide/polyol phosphate transport system ATPase subunit